MSEWTPEIRARLSSLRLAPTREAEIVEELSLHLEDRRRELVAGGASMEEATRETLAELRRADLLAKYMAPLRQSHWADPARPAAPGWFLLGGVVTDLRDAVRALRAAPSLTIVALLVLTLGIGATTAIYSVVDAVVLRGLPFEDSDRLVAVGERYKAGAKMGGPSPTLFGAADPQALRNVQPQNYLDWVAQQQAFESIAAIASGDVTLVATDSDPEAVLAQRVTASFFDVLRVRPAIGRAFTADQEVEGRGHVVIISDAFWRRRFGGLPSVIGQTVTLDGETYDVIGVMPPRFAYPVAAVKPTDLWVPYIVPASERVRARSHSIYLQSIARLRPEMSVEQADAHMGQVAAAIEQANPDWSRGSSAGVRPLRDHLVGASMRSWMLMLLAAVGIVLLIACANVANLLMARAAAGQREVALRSALGAGRWRLVRQFLVESLLLATSGAALGVLAAWWAIAVLRQAMPEEVPRAAAIGLNLRVLATASGLAIATGILCGILPAFQSSRPNLAHVLNRGTRGGGLGRISQRLRHVLVVAELALAVVLVVGSALFIGSFVRVMRLDPGFNPDRVLTAQVFQRRVPGVPPVDLSAAIAEIVEQVSRQSGVVAVSAANPGVPLRPNQFVTDFGIRGMTLPRSAGINVKIVTPQYHRALGISLRQGRLFTDADLATSEKVAILNEAAVKTYFPSSDPIGQAAVVNGADRVVIGVVSDARQANLEVAAEPEIYFPWSQGGTLSSAYLVVRTTDAPSDVLPAVKSAVRRVLPNMPLRYVATMDQLAAGQTAQRRLTMLMLGLFGVLGLVIAAVGIYGVMAYLVSRRTREIGVRMALGASRSSIVRMVLTNVSVLLASGIAIGGVGAWYLGVTAKTFLFGLEPGDPRAFVTAIAALLAAAVAATLIPARRAASVDPTVALRAE